MYLSSCLQAQLHVFCLIKQDASQGNVVPGPSVDAL